MTEKIENYVLESSKWIGCRLRDLSIEDFGEIYKYRPTYADRQALREFAYQHRPARAQRTAYASTSIAA